MKLKILFGQRKESYIGQFAPETIGMITTEFLYDEFPEGFDDECKEFIKRNSNEFIALKVIDVEVNTEQLRNLILSTPTIKGEL
jgi:hypothetical protein